MASPVLRPPEAPPSTCAAPWCEAHHILCAHSPPSSFAIAACRRTLAMADDAALLAGLVEKLDLDAAKRMAVTNPPALDARLKELGFKMGARAKLYQLLRSAASETIDVPPVAPVAVAAPATLEPVARRPFTDEEMESIRADCFANDVPVDIPGLANCSEEQLIAYFESGGEVLPEGVEEPVNRAPVKKAVAPPPPPPPPKPPPPPPAKPNGAGPPHSCTRATCWPCRPATARA